VVLVVALKYVVFVMRADNQGEGGTMALLSLALPVAGRLRGTLLVVGLAGASLFFGDAMITPAISVLSAVEGMEVAAPRVAPYVVPIAAAVLTVLFAIQRHGSGSIGKLFGPVMVMWFATLALAGLAHVVQHPGIVAALDPRYAISYAAHADGWTAFTVLGSVFLALTGGEALYADMGHFGRGAIRIDWFAFVMPALVLNYLGQGALVLSDPAAAENPFFHLFPGLTVARGVWKWPVALVVPAAGLFLVLDVVFVSANVHKIPQGGWFPLLTGTAALTLMLC
jgi:KUP system potassium uptake protein